MALLYAISAYNNAGIGSIRGLRPTRATEAVVPLIVGVFLGSVGFPVPSAFASLAPYPAPGAW